jgi:hypothetical protein
MSQTRATAVDGKSAGSAGKERSKPPINRLHRSAQSFAQSTRLSCHRPVLRGGDIRRFLMHVSCATKND